MVHGNDVLRSQYIFASTQPRVSLLPPLSSVPDLIPCVLSVFFFSHLENIWSALVEHMLNTVASMQSLIGHDLTRADFENPEVFNAANPSSWSYHSGERMPCICPA
ncbi:hypothetical protein BDW66DRAFT_124350 [Aspergillus desertorum]